MHFDDRLATVLRQRASSDAIGRIQFRQLLDLLGTSASEDHTEQLDEAYLRLAELSRAIPAADRAAMLREPVLRLRSPRLVAMLALAEPAAAAAAIGRADLTDDQWLDLVPALPVRARGIMRHRRGWSERVAGLLAQLGVRDRALPPGENEAIPEEISHPSVPPAAEMPAPTAPIEEIGAIVRRIEAYRKTRQLAEQETGGDAPRLPLGELSGDTASTKFASFDFATDGEGRIVWADSAAAPATVGLRLATRDPESPTRAPLSVIAALRHRQPLANAPFEIIGAPAIAGEWRVDAAPRFEPAGGRFVGYIGRMRRPSPDAVPVASNGNGDGDRMRQILHELRTPVNAIQGFAEIIQQQLYGPTPHEYRALAASIAGDSARILAGFDELDRFAKLESGALTLDAGSCDLAAILATTIAQLDTFNTPRRSGFLLDSDEAALPTALAQDEAGRLVWRLLATLAVATAPGEILKLRARRRDGAIRLSIRLPSSLALLDGEEALFQAGAGQHTATLGTGMFGTGFALRLAAAEAQAAGGSLRRREDRLRLVLPGLTADAPGHSEFDEALPVSAESA